MAFSQWIQQNSGTNSFLLKVRMIDASTGYIIGDSSHVLKTTNGGASLIRKETCVADCYKLEQNYPNPFNASTKISFLVPEYGFVSLKVFDLRGNEIKSLVNENKPAGNYSVHFNVPTLSSGVYICKLSAGGFLKTMKMILIK